MPEIAYSPQVEPEPLPGRAFPHLPGQVPPGAFGGEIGKAIEFGGYEVQRHVDAAMHQARQVQFADADNKAQALQIGLQKDALSQQGQNAFGIEDRYMQKYQEGSSQILEGVKDPLVREQLQAHLQKRGFQLQEQIQGHELQQHQKVFIDAHNDAAKLAIEGAGANANHPEIVADNRMKLDASTRALAQFQGWPQEKLDETLYENHARLNESVVESLLSEQRVGQAKAYYDSVKDELRPKDRQVFERAIEAGQVDQTANDILQSYRQNADLGSRDLSQVENNKNLTPEQQSAVIRKVQSGVNELAVERRADPANRRQLNYLDDLIAKRETTEGTLGLVESLRRKGVLTDDQAEVKRDAVLRALRTGQDQQAGFDYVQDAYSNRKGQLDPERDKKDVSDWFYKTVPDKPGSSAYNAYAAEATARLGVMPDPVASYARGALTSGPAPEAAKAARLLDTIDQTNHIAYEYGTDARLRSMAYGINEAVSAGADAEGAVEHEREIGKIDPARKKLLDDEWVNPKRHSLEFTDAGLIRKSLAQDEHYTLPGKLWGRDESSVPKIPSAMEGEYNALRKQYFYLRDGNDKEAHELAMRDLKRVWGVSEVNGERQLMKFAPERLFPNLPVADIRSDLAKEGYGAARLQESPETASSGGRIWNLVEPDQFGFPAVVRVGDKAPAPPTVPKAEGLREPGTISNLFDRPVLRNPDGSYSTTLSFSIGTDKGETLIPQVVNGKKLSREEAIARFKQTGEHLGVFDTAAHADAYATALHNEQDRVQGPAVRSDVGMPLRYQLPQPARPYTWEREFEANQARIGLQKQRERENRTAEEGGDIAQTRVPHL